MDLLSKATGISKSTLYRKAPPNDKPRKLRSARPANALSKAERDKVMEVMSSEEFIEDTPWQIVPKLLDRGIWYCSQSTMYRLLRANSQCKERRNQRRHPKYIKPEIEVHAPCQAWSWDITRIAGPLKGQCYFLYVMLDLFSRYVVGWMVSSLENSAQAKHFIRECVVKQGVDPHKLLIHSDRGSPMTAQTTVKLLATLGLSQSFARPRTSNDNPYSEAQFKTLKYHRLFKPWYGSLKDAEETLDKFFSWYNNEHMHSGIGFMTPATVHNSRDGEVKETRFDAMKKAYENHPERFSRGAVLPLPPEKVVINKPKGMKRAIKYLEGNAILK